ncbi:hypothetical protein ACFL3F_05540 [Planctomycetota bacterium]
MKTWIVTLEVIGFLLAYFLVGGLHLQDETDAVIPNHNSGHACCIEHQPWFVVEITMADCIRPPPHASGDRFLCKNFVVDCRL